MRINGFIRIDGDVDGNLETAGNIIIGEKARIRGNITANSAIISGIVLGNITAKEGIQMLSSSAVLGDVITKNLRLEETAILQGHCISLKNEENYTKEAKEYLETKSIRDRAVIS
jgi:cytoskeletal protein CcmA (bactofilin family)